MSSRARALFLTARPKTLTAAIVPILVATTLAQSEGYPVKWWVSVCALLSAVFIQIGTNFVNDALDFIKGADKETRLGDARASQSGWFTAKSVLWMGGVCFFLALVLGIPLVFEGGLPIMIVGLVSLLMGYAYTGGPWPLAYVGLGDLFVVIFFGLVSVGGVYFLQTQGLSVSALIAGLQIGLLATVLIAINNLRDLDQDRQIGKRTLAVRLGPRLGRWEVFGLIVGATSLQIFWFVRGWYWAALLPLVVLPFAYSLLNTLLRSEASRVYNRLLARAAFVHMIFGVLLSLGFGLQ